MFPVLIFSSCNPFAKDKEEKPEKINVFFFTLKDNPEQLKVGTTYWVNIRSDYYTAKEMMVSVNNGQIINSTIPDWGFEFTPDETGSIRISVHFKKRKTGEMDMESVHYTVVE